MSKLIVLLLPLAVFGLPPRKALELDCECGKENTENNRISGGSIASPNQYPWMVRLQTGCGGSLISDRHVLTAYHCVDRGAGSWVKVSVHDQWNSSDYQTVAVDRAVWPDKSVTGHHDIAIIILAEPVTFERTIHPVCLPASDELVYKGERTTHAGWGMTHVGSGQSRYLKHVDLTVSYAPTYKNYFYTDIAIIDGVPHDPCAGDSGGPLMHQDPTTKRWTIIGTVYGGGYDCRTGNGAYRKGYWNKVTAHLDWIKDILANDQGVRCQGGLQQPPDCNCGMANRLTRIVNGVDTEVNEYPWQAGLVSTGGSWIFCGGSLINNKYVLTAAHCTAGQSAGRIQVLLGEHDKTTTTETETVRKSVSAIIDHPSYDRRTINYDYSLLKLSSPVDWSGNSHIRPVCLPDAGTTFDSGDPLVVTGWGATSSGGSTADVLQEAVVNYVDNTECENRYGRGKISSAMMCAATPSKDSCQGDSGGPLVHARSNNNNNYALAGVVSWGYGCADPNYPGVYARVTSVLPWINDNTADAQSCPEKS